MFITVILLNMCPVIYTLFLTVFSEDIYVTTEDSYVTAVVISSP